jgi:hypothetical protein
MLIILEVVVLECSFLNHSQGILGIKIITCSFKPNTFGTVIWQCCIYFITNIDAWMV